MTPRLFDSVRDDVRDLAALHQNSFAQAWSAQALADLLATPGVFAIHLQDGFILARVAAGEAEVLTLAVNPDARGRGLGRVLLRAAAQQAQGDGATHMFLEVRVDNPSALALYAGQGFVPVGRRKAYYEGRDALILRTQLPLPQPGEFA